mmetsp:Transcript_10993/g.19118  ORF Transcript_10993/g.19118 Transcript_10993/m.19118 type:complete len:95 (-) Transcript_10993:250-534(-)
MFNVADRFNPSAELIARLSSWRWTSSGEIDPSPRVQSLGDTFSLSVSLSVLRTNFEVARFIPGGDPSLSTPISARRTNLEPARLIVIDGVCTLV